MYVVVYVLLLFRSSVPGFQAWAGGGSQLSISLTTLLNPGEHVLVEQTDT